MDTSSEHPSGTSTPRSFQNQSVNTEELLKVQTTGLVTLEDFRKRRAQAADQRHQQVQVGPHSRLASNVSGIATVRDNDKDE